MATIAPASARRAQGKPVRSKHYGMPRGSVRVAVVGCGYWGPNLIRNFLSCPNAEVVLICDADAVRLERFAKLSPRTKVTQNFADVISDPGVDAVAIATPVDTHAQLALTALEAGKHVLVEKPMANNVTDAEEMVHRASEAGLVLMVDHTFLYSPPVRKIKEIVDRGDLGDMYFIDSVRINLGLFQHDINVVWDLAPHDLAILDFLVRRVPRSLSAFGSCHTSNGSGLEDVAYLSLDFGDGLVASFHVNWLSPVKVRHFILGGSRKSIVYNDLEPAEKIKVYDRGITLNHDPDRRRGVLVGYRTGDVWSPHLESTEPLQTMTRHFVDCIQERRTPITDGASGLRVVRVLAAAERSIKAQGGRITL